MTHTKAVPSPEIAHLNDVQRMPPSERDWKIFLTNNYLDEYYQSVNTRKLLAELIPVAINRTRDILEMELTEKAAPTILKAAEMVLNKNILEPPKLSYAHIQHGMDDAVSSAEDKEAQYTVEIGQMKTALLDALESETEQRGKEVERAQLETPEVLVGEVVE